jgi:hypothetical protein
MVGPDLVVRRDSVAFIGCRRCTFSILPSATMRAMKKNNDSAPMNIKPLIQMTLCRYKPNLKLQKMRDTKSDRIAWF